MEAAGGFFNSGFGKARDLEEAPRHESIAGGIEGGGGFGFVRSDGRVGIEVCAGADANFEFVEGAIGFDDAVPAEGRTGLGESGHSAGRLTAIGAGFHGGQSIAMEDETHADIKNHRGEREARPDSSPRAFRFGTDFLRHQPAERGKKNSSKKNSQKPEIQVGDPVEREAARRERPKEFHAGALTNVHEEMEKCGGQGGNENWGGGYVLRARFTFAQEKRQSDRQAQQNSRNDGVEVRAIESEKGGRAPMEALAVKIREDSRGQDGKGGRPRRPRKYGALQCVGGQGMSQRVHG